MTKYKPAIRDLRNRIISKSQKYFGVSNVIWLGKGIVGDDTHGHVDDLCRFVNEDTVVLASEENSSDENYNLLNENKKDFRIFTCHWFKFKCCASAYAFASNIQRTETSRQLRKLLHFKYAVLVPTFNDPNDKIALGILSEFFPDRK